jgi:uncharacterized protein (UPF0335 family)
MMRDENTKDLTQDEKLNLILAKVSSIEAEMSGMKSDIIEVKSDTTGLTGLYHRLASLDAKVDERLHDTRPMWQAIHAQTEMLVERMGRIENSNLRVEEQLKVIHHQLEELTLDVMEVRAVKRELKKRVAALEQQLT